MRVLVAIEAPREGPGRHFAYTEVGEPVGAMALVCTDPARADRCGCGRSFLGKRSGQACTRAVVVEAPGPFRERGVPGRGTADARLRHLVQRFPVGTVLEVRNGGDGSIELRPAGEP